jgi:hypothetical protein
VEVLEILLKVFSLWLFNHWRPVTRQALGDMEDGLNHEAGFALIEARKGVCRG